MSRAQIVAWAVVAALLVANVASLADLLVERIDQDRWATQCIDDGGMPIYPGCLSPDAMHLPHYDEGARP